MEGCEMTTNRDYLLYIGGALDINQIDEIRGLHRRAFWGGAGVGAVIACAFFALCWACFGRLG